MNKVVAGNRTTVTRIKTKPSPGIKPGSPEGQAGILTTILQQHDYAKSTR